MGIGLKVSCPCFGSFTLQVGARIALPKYCLFPFLCTECEAASALNINAGLLACDHCGSASVIPYGSHPAVGELGSTVVFACSPSDRFSAEQLTLTNGTYWCPTCRHHTTRFSDAGIMWD
jgi:ribosomal protein L37AE/L43A